MSSFLKELLRLGAIAGLESKIRMKRLIGADDIVGTKVLTHNFEITIKYLKRKMIDSFELATSTNSTDNPHEIKATIKILSTITPPSRSTRIKHPIGITYGQE